MSHEMVPAVVVGGDLSALGVARSLWLADVPVYAVTTRSRPVVWSRSCRSVIVDQLHGEGLVDRLLALHRQIGERPVLLLADEMAVFTVSAHRSALEQAYRFRLPAEALVTGLTDKAKFQKLAEDNGFPVPRSVVLEQATDIGRLDELDFPVIVKPADKHFVHSGDVDRIQKALTPDEAVGLCSRLLPIAKKIIVQEWVPGPDSSIFFCLFYRGVGGKLIAMFTGKKLLADPPELGSTVICCGAPEAAHLLESLTSAFADCVGFDGMGSLELKRDSIRDRFVIIEPTVGRVDWQEEIATLCGVNIPLIAYRDELGLEPMPIGRPRDDIAWRASLLKSWPRQASRTGMRVYDGFWRSNDPVPALFHYGVDSVYRHVIDPFLSVRAIKCLIRANAASTE